jgi:broad specificity phosphatase PhoE
MKIGLVRHFKVNVKPGEGGLTSSEFERAMNNYDKADVIPNTLKINSNDWDICYSSSLPRAVKTAKTIYSGEIITSDLLREVPILPFTKRNFVLPTFFWHMAARIAWVKNRPSQPEGKLGTEERINKFLEIINSSNHERILIVSHGFFMGSLFRILIKMGFKGEMDVRPRNGKLYILEK